jgi:hypothetical protein
MNSLLDRLFRVRLACSIQVDDTTVRDRSMAELRALLADIATPSTTQNWSREAADIAEDRDTEVPPLNRCRADRVAKPRRQEKPPPQGPSGFSLRHRPPCF